MSLQELTQLQIQDPNQNYYVDEGNNFFFNACTIVIYPCATQHDSSNSTDNEDGECQVCVVLLKDFIMKTETVSLKNHRTSSINYVTVKGLVL